MTGSKQATIQVEVNGEQVTAEVPTRMIFADFLRSRLRLTGTHLGCEHGVCGACTVLVDDQPVRSCLMLAAQADGSSVRTIESVAPSDETLHPVQQAMKECHGLQCGFCTPGLVMTMVAMTESDERPDDETVDELISGHLCRCTGYTNIAAAARLSLDLTHGSEA